MPAEFLQTSCRDAEDSSLPSGPFSMSRSEPSSPKRSRSGETTGVVYPTGAFKARAPAVHACRAHDKKRLCTDQIHSPTRAHIHPDARHCPHRTVPEMTTGTRQRKQPRRDKREKPCALSLARSLARLLHCTRTTHPRARDAPRARFEPGTSQHKTEPRTAAPRGSPASLTPGNSYTFHPACART